MAENDRFSLRIPWATLLKVIAAVVLVAVLVRIWYILTLILIAIIVAVGLYPAVLWLERRRWSRGAAASVVVFALLGLIVAFLAATWSSIMGQAHDVVQHLEQAGNQLAAQLPEPLAKALPRMSGPNTSSIASSVLWVAQSKPRRRISGSAASCPPICGRDSIAPRARRATSRPPTSSRTS